MQQFVRSLSPLCLLVLLLALPACRDAGSAVAGLPEDEEEEDRPLHRETLTPQVGVNYNGQLDRIELEDLERSQTTWVRGFVDFFLFYEDPQRLETDPRILKYLELQGHGYKTILNLKWDFHGRSFPAPGSAELDDYKTFLRKMLDRLWTGTNIVVVGNEPFIESRAEERNAELVGFYKEIARFLNDYRKKGANVPIYIGAFNNLYLSRLRTEGVEELLSFAKKESWISGVDLHIHHGGIDQIDQTLAFVHPRIRDDQRILITEYSLVKHWKSKMGEAVPQPFAEAYGWDSSTLNHEYLDYALKNPVAREEWVDFLRNSYWYENRTNYLGNSYQRFRSYDKFYIATYAMRQSFPFNRDFTAEIDPWILNGIYANRTVVPDPATGQNQFNYAWIHDFQAIQRGDFD